MRFDTHSKLIEPKYPFRLLNAWKIESVWGWYLLSMLILFNLLFFIDLEENLKKDEKIEKKKLKKDKKTGEKKMVKNELLLYFNGMNNIRHANLYG